MKHLHCWIGLKKVIAKIRNGATFWKQPLKNILFKMLYFVGSSTFVAVQAPQTFAYHVCFVLLFDTDESRTLAEFKMELFGTKVNCWNLLLLLFCLIRGRCCTSTSEKHRDIIVLNQILE